MGFASSRSIYIFSSYYIYIYIYSHLIIIYQHSIYEKPPTYFVCPVYIITVGEKRSKVALTAPSCVVMIVMVFGASIEGNQLGRAEWEVVAANFNKQLVMHVGASTSYRDWGLA